jgi:hypothetical protein
MKDVLRRTAALCSVSTRRRSAPPTSALHPQAAPGQSGRRLCRHRRRRSNKCPRSSTKSNDAEDAASSPIINDRTCGRPTRGRVRHLPKLWNYTGAHNTPRSQQFAKTYQQKNGQPPEVERGRIGSTRDPHAIKETKSTDSRQIIGFLEQHKFEGCGICRSFSATSTIS